MPPKSISHALGQLVGAIFHKTGVADFRVGLHSSLNASQEQWTEVGDTSGENARHGRFRRRHR